MFSETWRRKWRVFAFDKTGFEFQVSGFEWESRPKMGMQAAKGKPMVERTQSCRGMKPACACKWAISRRLFEKLKSHHRRQ